MEGVHQEDELLKALMEWKNQVERSLYRHAARTTKNVKPCLRADAIRCPANGGMVRYVSSGCKRLRSLKTGKSMGVTTAHNKARVRWLCAYE